MLMNTLMSTVYNKNIFLCKDALLIALTGNICFQIFTQWHLLFS